MSDIIIAGLMVATAILAVIVIVIIIRNVGRLIRNMRNAHVYRSRHYPPQPCKYELQVLGGHIMKNLSDDEIVEKIDNWGYGNGVPTKALNELKTRLGIRKPLVFGSTLTAQEVNLGYMGAGTSVIDKDGDVHTLNKAGQWVRNTNVSSTYPADRYMDEPWIRATLPDSFQPYKFLSGGWK